MASECVEWMEEEKCKGLRLGQKDKWAKRKEKKILETSVRGVRRPWYLVETMFVYLLINL